MRARVITMSDRSAAGERDDVSGPLLVAALVEAGHETDAEIVPDGEASVGAALGRAVAAGARVVLTTGGTGVGPRDRTPEGTLDVVDRQVPGLAEALRAHGAASSPHAWLSRGVAGVVDAGPGRPGALVVNLPGNPAGARDGVAFLLPLVGHVIDQLGGGDHP